MHFKIGDIIKTKDNNYIQRAVVIKVDERDYNIMILKLNVNEHAYWKKGDVEAFNKSYIEESYCFEKRASNEELMAMVL
jgi:hypothetical protein